MQYKIPVQIENEDPVFLGMSLRQLTILMIGGTIGYSIFKSLEPQLGFEIALIPFILIAGIALAIAKFRIAEMTFVQFIIAFIRLKVNYEVRTWIKGIDSYQPLDIGYLTKINGHSKEKIDFQSKIDKINKLEDKISKI